MPPPELIDDAVAEILLRLPPDDPACLVRASLVCKPWRRIASSPTFLRRYRRFHRSSPPLAFIAGSYFLDPTPRFVPTTDTASPFRRRHAVPYDCRGYFPLDCRHGRLLLKKLENDHFLVWDPITGGRDLVPEPPIVWFAAAVRCATAGCDHSNCHRDGPYLVLCMGTDNMLPIVHACVYSSRDGSWGALVSVNIGASYVTPARGTLVGDAMYFVLGLHNKILKYNFAEHCLSVIHPLEVYDKGIVLMVTEDGLLGLSGIRDFNLYLWSREADAEGVEWWVQTRMIDLQRLLPVDNPFNPVERAVVTGFAEGACVIFVSTDIGGFVIELKTGRVRKVAEPGRYYPVIPFISFCTPGFPIDIGKMCSGSN